MFWRIFIFRGHLTCEPATVVCDDEQGDLFYSAGTQHMNLQQLCVTMSRVTYFTLRALST